MDQYKSEFVRSLVSRGYHYQATDLEGIDRAALQGGLNAYIGFDCTAPSLHVGSLVQIMLLRRLQQAGGRPIVLLGGGTTKINHSNPKFCLIINKGGQTAGIGGGNQGFNLQMATV